MTETQGVAPRPASYPYMSVSQLMQIRARLKSSLPKAITYDWLQSVLSISEKAAKNLHPQLRRLGLIDTEGALQQPLVNDFREDDTYAEACRRIITGVYPQALLDAFPEPRRHGWYLTLKGSTGNTLSMPMSFFSAPTVEAVRDHMTNVLGRPDHGLLRPKN